MYHSQLMAKLERLTTDEESRGALVVMVGMARKCFSVFAT